MDIDVPADPESLFSESVAAFVDAEFGVLVMATESVNGGCGWDEAVSCPSGVEPLDVG